jgi:osmotically-inducible protein OsmY
MECSLRNPIPVKNKGRHIASPLEVTFVGSPEEKKQVMAPTMMSPRAVDSTMQVRRALDFSGYYALRSVEVYPTDDGVRLSGIVPTYYLKQLAQSLAMDTDGVFRVDNEVLVQ